MACSSLPPSFETGSLTESHTKQGAHISLSPAALRLQSMATPSLAKLL